MAPKLHGGPDNTCRDQLLVAAATLGYPQSNVYPQRPQAVANDYVIRSALV